MRLRLKKPKEKKAPSWQVQLKALTDEYVELEKRLSNLKDKYSYELSRMEELEDEKEALHIRIQDIAREHAETGQTLRFIDDKNISVEVQAPQASTQYDYRLARKYWPKEVLKKCLTIDAKRVQEVINDLEDIGVSEKVLMKAALPRQPLTPRVIVKLKT